VRDEVVITGLGIMSPIGCSESRFWESLCLGRHGAAPVTGFDTTELPRSIACQIHEPVESKPGLARASHLAVAAARQAVEAAGLLHTLPDRARTLTIVGTTMGETQRIEDRLAAAPAEWLTPEHLQRIHEVRPGRLAKNVQADLGVHGEAFDLYGACAAGNMALAVACGRLLNHRCDVAIVGGADGFSILAFVGFMRLRVMAASICRPFDAKRDGLLVGEGAGMFVLERASDARARGATVRARVSGCGLASEAYHPTRPNPEGDGLTRATRQALEAARLSPSDIDYVCSHGTGTPHNDAIEVAMMERCFPEGVAFSSIKALTGHPMGAAAALEAAACVLSIQHQTLIPTWHLEEPLGTGGLDAIRGEVRHAPVVHTLNNSAGFGGYNCSVVLSAA